MKKIFVVFTLLLIFSSMVNAMYILTGFDYYYNYGWWVDWLCQPPMSTPVFEFCKDHIEIEYVVLGTQG